MDREVECMCLDCGVSLYLEAGLMVLGGFIEGDMRVVDNIYCSQCGGQLFVVGKAGEEPAYRTREKREQIE